MWVMTQYDRELAIELVDAAVDVIRNQYGYTLP
jgi:hypothetical protein